MLALGCVGLISSCAARELELVDGSAWKRHVEGDVGRSQMRLSELRFRESVCEGLDLTPSYQPLSDAHLVQFFEARGLSVSVERQRADLAYVVVDGGSTRQPARLRVAILADPHQAGLELSRAIAEHGKGSWGVHRSNLAVLGPIGSAQHDLSFAAETQLVCWGVFTIMGKHGPLAVPGGYREL